MGKLEIGTLAQSNPGKCAISATLSQLKTECPDGALKLIVNTTQFYIEEFPADRILGAELIKITDTRPQCDIIGGDVIDLPDDFPQIALGSNCRHGR